MPPSEPSSTRCSRTSPQPEPAPQLFRPNLAARSRLFAQCPPLRCMAVGLEGDAERYLDFIVQQANSGDRQAVMRTDAGRLWRRTVTECAVEYAAALRRRHVPLPHKAKRRRGPLATTLRRARRLRDRLSEDGLFVVVVVACHHPCSGMAQSSSFRSGQLPAKCIPTAGAEENSRQRSVDLSRRK